ncbi:MAG: hypothetical protein HDR08_08830 [Lachnospiraceae bacterium]|nr:hypothetical protein [Lachnospiraceae bacterium]
MQAGGRMDEERKIAMRNNDSVKNITITDIKGVFTKDGFRDMLLMFFGLTQTLFLKVILRIPGPLRVIAAVVLLSGYVNLLLFTGPAATVLTVILTTFVKKRIKGWNVELKIMKYMTRLRAQ